MIHKIEKIVSIGKFRNYRTSGDVAFKKLTLFYGDNGSGKTTLTAIFRSLTQNKPLLITRRQSTNSSVAQAAQIIQRTGSSDTFHTFNSSGWSTPFPDIEIFDIHFVNENIYSGFDFNDEHKKQLHQFVIGAQGVAIQQQIEQNKANKTASRRTQTGIEDQLIRQVRNNLTTDLITSYLSIGAIHAINIDQKIASAQAALTSANANSVIQSLPHLSQLAQMNSGIDFARLLTDLQTTTQAIQDAALQSLFQDHCKDLSENSIESPENWLQTGFAYLESKQETSATLFCPFCKQTVSNSLDIIRAFAIRFDADFNSLVERLQSNLSTLQAFNLEASIQNLNNIRQTNTQNISSWAAHLPNTTQSPIFNFTAQEEAIRIELRALISTVQQKAQNPSALASTAILTAFQSTLQSINTGIVAYNQSVANFNRAISVFRSGIQSPIQAQTALDELNRTKQRFDPTIATLCTQLIAERQNLRTLETAYPQLVQQQEVAAATFFTNYKNRINHYLATVFKTPFRIDDVIHIPPRGMATQSKIGYKLTIDGQDISFDPNQSRSAKDCLSEGDKSTIALAFFLSKMDIDPGLSNKVLVFDDPLSSFDSNRRMCTVELIKNLFPNVKQLIVLSHNEHFLFEISKTISAQDKKALRVIENFLTNESIIEPLTLETLVENDYFKHIKELEDFLQHPDITRKEIVLGWLRNVLESHIRFKFYRQISVLPPNSQTLGRLISTLTTQGVVFRDNANRATIISKLNLINGISCRPHHGDPMPDYATLGADPNSMNVTELASFVIDTLDLVDNKL